MLHDVGHYVANFKTAARKDKDSGADALVAYIEEMKTVDPKLQTKDAFKTAVLSIAYVYGVSFKGQSDDNIQQSLDIRFPEDAAAIGAAKLKLGLLG